jgi:peptidyl-tRNA hydrolase
MDKQSFHYDLMPGILREDMQSKMYILVREKMIEENFGLAIVSVAHAAAAAILEWQLPWPEKEIEPYTTIEEWQKTSFKKVVCQVTEEQFQQAMKDFGPCGESYLLMTESSIDNGNMCLVFRPRKEWPKFFKYLKMWSGEPNLEKLFRERDPMEISKVLEAYINSTPKPGPKSDNGPSAVYKGVCFDVTD